MLNPSRKFKYLGTRLLSANYTHKEVTIRLNSGNALYHSVQDILSSRLMSENLILGNMS
jgi:hypothetical protein